MIDDNEGSGVDGDYIDDGDGFVGGDCNNGNGGGSNVDSGSDDERLTERLILTIS